MYNGYDFNINKIHIHFFEIYIHILGALQVHISILTFIYEFSKLPKVLLNVIKFEIQEIINFNIFEFHLLIAL